MLKQSKFTVTTMSLRKFKNKWLLLPRQHLQRKGKKVGEENRRIFFPNIRDKKKGDKYLRSNS